MKKTICYLILTFLILSLPIHSEEPKEIGKASVEAVKTAKRKNWTNWAIAIVAIVGTAVGLTVIATHQGSHAH